MHWGPVLAWIYLLLLRLWCNHQLPSNSWLLRLVSNFWFCLFLMVFLAKRQETRIRLRTTCAGLSRVLLFLASTWTRMTWLLWNYDSSISGPLLLTVPSSLLFLLLLFQLRGSLQLSQLRSLSTELPLLDHFAHEYSLRLHHTYLKLHVIKLGTESKTFQWGILLSELNTYSTRIIVQRTLILSIYVLLTNLTVVLVKVIAVTRERRLIALLLLKSVTECFLPSKAYQCALDVSTFRIIRFLQSLLNFLKIKSISPTFMVLLHESHVANYARYISRYVFRCVDNLCY